MPDSFSRRARLSTPLIFICACIVCMAGCSRSHLKGQSSVLAERGWAKYQAHDYKGAEKALTEAIRLNSEDARAHYVLGLVLRDTGEVDAAIEHLYRAHQIQPDYEDSVLVLSQLMVKSREVQQVRWSGDFARRVLAKNTDANKRAEALYVLGVGSLRLDDADAANGYFRKALLANPYQSGSVIYLALQEADAGKVEAGEQMLRSAIDRQPKSVPLNSALAEFLRAARKPAQAETQFRRVLELDPNNVAARVNLVDILCASGRSAEAQTVASLLAEQSGSGFEHWHALLLLRDGHTDDAIRELRQLADSAPEKQTARLRLISALLLVGKTDQAKTEIGKLERNGKHTRESALMRAQLALNEGNTASAASLVEEVLRIDPAWGEPHLLAAQLADVRHSSAKAKYELGEALRLQPGLQSARLAFTRYSLAQHDPDNALAILDQDPAKQQSQYAALVQRTWVLLARGEWSEAAKISEGVGALEQSRDIASQRLLINVTLRTRAWPRGMTSQPEWPMRDEVVTPELLQIASKYPPSTADVMSLAAKLGSQPVWQAYGNDLIVLPRGVFRESLDPDGLLSLKSFGAWEPVIHLY